jgi:catecholate siderophore receptor
MRSAPIDPIASALSVCVSSLLGFSAAQADTAPVDPLTSDDEDRKLQEVTVSGVRPLLHDKLPQDLQDTPQSITVVSQQLMSEQAVTRLEDALKNVPGITLNAGEGAARGDTVNLRGFSAFNDFFLDGIRDAAVYSRDSFDLESVEVVKGPSAVLFGRGSTGGAINQVS